MGTINSRIREVRKKRGLTQSELADLIGLKQNAVSYMEKEGSTVTEYNLNSISKALMTTKDYLKTGSGQMDLIEEEDEFMKIATQISIEDDRELMDFMIKYWKLDPEKKELLKNFLKM